MSLQNQNTTDLIQDFTNKMLGSSPKRHMQLHNHINGTQFSGAQFYGGVGVTPEMARTPYIMEQSQMRYSQIDVFSRLMADGIIWCSGVVNDYMSDVVTAQMLYLAQTNPDRSIKLYINSPGGSVYAGLTMTDTMDLIKAGKHSADATPIIIETLNMGMAASMGSVLLANGSKGYRTAMKNSRTMLHQSSGGFGGNIQDAMVSMKEWERLNTSLAQMLSDNSNKTLEEILADTNRDLWLLASDALEYGLIDSIIGA